MIEALLGPLVEPECRRMAQRRWTFWARVLAALPVAGTVLIAAWIFWLYRLFEAQSLPVGVLIGALITAEGMAVAAAFLLAPATLASPLGGENQQGALDVLLIARVSAGEILVARLLSRLAQAYMILLATLPGIVWLGGLCSLSILQLAAVVLLPFAVAFGGAGLAVGVSAVSRRARDALVGVYLLQISLLAAPILIGVFFTLPELNWLLPLNPFPTTYVLLQSGDSTSIWLSIFCWTGLGFCGTAFGSWRLRPSYLRRIGGSVARKSNRRGKKRRQVGRNPMLWKEIFADSRATLGWVSRFLGRAFVAILIVVSMLFAAAVYWESHLGMPSYYWREAGVVAWMRAAFVTIIVSTGLFLPWLVQWAIGLRAAVSIASERERQTWDSILTTPMDGKEIVTAKMLGSVTAMRWVLGAVAFAWVTAVACGEITAGEFVVYVLDVLTVGFFMAVVGVWFSLCSKTTARAMTLTLVIWVAASIVVPIASVFIALFAMLGVWLVMGIALGWTGSTGLYSSPISFEIVWQIGCYALYLLMGVAALLFVRSRFDKLAGRSPVDYRAYFQNAQQQPISAGENPFGVDVH